MVASGQLVSSTYAELVCIERR